MSGCIRCHKPEFRIHGFCSCECEDLHEREVLIRDLRNVIACVPNHSEYVRKLMADSEWAAAAFEAPR